MTAVMVTDISSDDAPNEDYWISSTDQILVTRNPQLLAAEPIRSVAEVIPPYPDFRIFTDDFYNLLRVLKW